MLLPFNTSWSPWLPLTFTASAALEEVVFRTGLQESLARLSWPAHWANVFTAVCFALAHGLTRSWLLAAWVLPAALLLGWLYGRTRRLWPCVFTHAAMNLIWLAVLISGAETWL